MIKIQLMNTLFIWNKLLYSFIVLLYIVLIISTQNNDIKYRNNFPHRFFEFLFIYDILYITYQIIFFRSSTLF
jgi:hypothetical protein